MTSGVRINWGPHVGDVSGRVLAVAASPRECGAVGGRGGWARPRGARTFFFLVDSRGTRRGRDVLLLVAVGIIIDADPGKPARVIDLLVGPTNHLKPNK
jgi:hypothetical protein